LWSRGRLVAGFYWVRVRRSGLVQQTLSETYTAFVKEVGPRVRMALIAAYGPERGAEATSEALAYGWEHWARVEGMENPAGYLYRVGRSRAGRSFLRPARTPLGLLSSNHQDPWVEPALPEALARLSHQQRVAVLLVHGFAWTLTEVGELFGVTPSTVQRHVNRGLAKLRKTLGVEIGT